MKGSPHLNKPLGILPSLMNGVVNRNRNSEHMLSPLSLGWKVGLADTCSGNNQARCL